MLNGVRTHVNGDLEHELIRGITQRMLAAQLRELEMDGLESRSRLPAAATDGHHSPAARMAA
ncbi:MAG TPA: winged helix-turn-helix transcriptional regulator [Burkholderiaceae bacterium]|nr:winged helix-turn-helix transcriptional regulator [Burkholderiaceae bacterium]